MDVSKNKSEKKKKNHETTWNTRGSYYMGKTFLVELKYLDQFPTGLGPECITEDLIWVT